MKDRRGGSSPAAIIAVVLLAAVLFAAVKASGILEVKARVKVKSIPPGALVLVDGAPAGTTPLDLGEIQGGPHTFRFVLEGYRDAVVVKTCAGDVTVEGKMEPLPGGELAVDSEPKGAKVFVDGVERGETPLTVRLAPGRHTLSVLKENYNEHVEDVTIEAGKSLERTVELVPAVESYYREAIERAPDDLMNYCDLMRYYYVRERFEDLVDLMFDGVAVMMKSRKKDDGFRRFIQEIGKVREDDPALYDKRIFPLVLPRLLKVWNEKGKHAAAMQLGDYFILGARKPERGMPLLFEALKEHRDEPLLYRYVVTRGTKAQALVRKLTSSDFSRLLELFLTCDEHLPAAEAADLLMGMAEVCKLRRDFSALAEVSRKAADLAAKVGDKKTEFRALNDLVVSLRVLKKYDEGERLVNELLARKDIPKVYRKLLERELKRIRRFKRIGK